MEILFATGHMPASKGRQAGQTTSYFLCEYLARKNRVHLLALAPEREISEVRTRDLEIFASAELLSVTRGRRALGALSAPRLPLSIAARNSSSFRARLRKRVAELSPDVVIFDHNGMFPYCAEVPAPAVTVGLAHDVYTQSWQRKFQRARNPIAKSLLKAESRRVAAWEAKAASTLDLVVVLNNKDKQLMEHLAPDSTVFAIEPWVVPLVRNTSSTREPGSILYWGAMDRAENADAARWAANEMLPAIRAKIPHALLYIAGSRGEQLAPEFAGREDVVITGFIEDVSAMMSRMQIALLPLRLGAGIKVKTLECMSVGLPVVTTSVGIEGVHGSPGVHFLLAETAEELAAHSIRLLSDAGEAERIGASAQSLIHREYNFVRTVAELEQHLQGMVVKKRDGVHGAVLSV